jgi:hypothetical protein
MLAHYESLLEDTHTQLEAYDMTVDATGNSDLITQIDTTLETLFSLEQKIVRIRMGAGFVREPYVEPPEVDISKELRDWVRVPNS